MVSEEGPLALYGNPSIINKLKNILQIMYTAKFGQKIAIFCKKEVLTQYHIYVYTNNHGLLTAEGQALPISRHSTFAARSVVKFLLGS